MAYALTIGQVSVVSKNAHLIKDECDCHQVSDLCTPSYVFSVEGQVGFREALAHLADCQKMDCRSVRSRVLNVMEVKLKWLMREQCLLGCVHVQPLLYGRKKLVLKRSEFPNVAQHLARCPRETCAQLRRALMLNIRDEMRPG